MNMSEMKRYQITGIDDLSVMLGLVEGCMVDDGINTGIPNHKYLEGTFNFGIYGELSSKSLRKIEDAGYEIKPI